MQAEFMTQRSAVGAGQIGREWERLFSGTALLGDAAYWRTLADRVAPRNAATKLAATTRAANEFGKPKLEMIAAMETALKAMLNGPGLRQVADSRAQLGYREADVPAGTLVDEDMVLDSYQELSATNWVSVRGVKARLTALEALRELLSAMVM